MAREYEDYRPLIEQLNQQFPDRELLTVRDVMQITGYKSKTTVRLHYPFKDGKILKTRLARLMAAE